jgi:hypothetical protein
MLVTSLLPSFLALSVVGAAQTLVAGQQERTSQNAGKPPAQEPSFIFRQVVPVLSGKSRVPLRLHGFLPDADEKHPIYATVQSVSSSSYDILLSVVVPCEGQNYCLYGSVRGSSSPFGLDDDSPKPVPVKLQGGIQGQFIDAVCHAYCSESYVMWSEGGFYYSIGINGGNMQSMIKEANSAIAIGAAKTADAKH